MQFFSRSPGRVELIEGTKFYARFLTKMFDQLDLRTGELKNSIKQSRLTMKVDPQFAAIWLVPRLASFAECHPDIELDVVTEERKFDPRHDEAPLAIQYVNPGETIEIPNVLIESLVSVQAFPVARLDILDRNPIVIPSDILKHPLLHGEDREWWQSWFDIAGIKTESPLPGPRFSQSYLALLAAEAGQGIALLDDIEAADALATGRLTRLTDVEIPGGQYLIMQNALTIETTAMRSIKDWLKSEMLIFKNSSCK